MSIKFANRLRELRIAEGLLQQDFATAIGISRSAVGAYERGQREPSFELLETIADYFNVDMGYLLGQTDVMRRYDLSGMMNAEPTDDELPVGLKFCDRLRERRSALSLSLRDVADACGVSAPTVCRWETGEIANLRGNHIIALARALHCSPAFLMGWEDEPTADPQKSRGEVGSIDQPDPQLDRVLGAWEQLNEEGQERVAEQAELLVDSGRYKKDRAPRMVEGA